MKCVDCAVIMASMLLMWIDVNCCTKHYKVNKTLFWGQHTAVRIVFVSGEFSDRMGISGYNRSYCLLQIFRHFFHLHKTYKDSLHQLKKKIIKNVK